MKTKNKKQELKGKKKMNFEPSNVSIKELTKKYKNGNVSPVLILQSELAKIDKMNPRINPFVHRFPKEVLLKQAKESEKRYRNGTPLGAFDGIPVTIKDDQRMKGYPSAMGSLLLDMKAFEFMGFGGKEPPDESEDVVSLFEESGAIILGITTTPELCALECTSTYLNGVTRNPHNLFKSPGNVVIYCVLYILIPTQDILIVFLYAYIYNTLIFCNMVCVMYIIKVVVLVVLVHYLH